MLVPYPLRRRLLRTLVALAIAAAALAPVVAHAEPPFVKPAEPVVIGVSDPARMNEVRARLTSLGGTVERRYRWGGYLVSLPASADRGGFTGAARGIPGVKYVTEQAMMHAAGTVTRSGLDSALGDSWLQTAWTPNDPAFPTQWALSRIGAPTAWDTATGEGVVVAIVDTGVDYTHPDLAGAVIPGWDYVGGDSNPMDANGHGTAMAGIAGAWSNNGLYGASVAPGCWLLAVRVLNSSGTGTAADVADGIVYAADNGADVINMSLSGPEGVGIEPIVDAVAYARSKGCLLVAASGNVGDYDHNTRMYPAACDGVIGAGATASTTAETIWSGEIHGTRADGTPVVTVVAPGESVYTVYTVYPAGTQTAGLATGTSASTAVISGAAAVVWSAHTTATADEIASILASSALDVDPAGRDTEAGWGRIRLDSALSCVAPDAPSDIAVSATTPAPAIRVTWTDTSWDEQGFVIERAQGSPTPGAYSHLATVSVNATSYVDTTANWSSTWWYRVRAFNAAGPSAYTTTSSGLKLDTTAPVTTLLVNGSPASSGWYNASSAPVSVSLSATDTQSGVGSRYYDLGGGTQPYSAPLTVSDGRNRIAFWSVDNAANTETANVATVSVDTAAPTVSSNATTTPYVGSATINISAADGLSGVQQIVYRVPPSGETSGAAVTLGVGTHQLYYRARDVAGNWAGEAGPITITVTGPGTLTGTVSSDGSPLSGVSVSVPGTGTVTTNGSGVYTVGGVTPGGPYTVTYSKTGYSTETTSVTIVSDTTTTKDMSLTVAPAPSTTPVYRFFNFRNGTHFYTASYQEMLNVSSGLSWTYNYEGEAFRVASPSDVGAAPVYRFFNFQKGTHFYTASYQEMLNVSNGLSWTFTYEGIAFYVPN